MRANWSLKHRLFKKYYFRNTLESSTPLNKSGALCPRISFETQLDERLGTKATTAKPMEIFHV